MLEMVNSFKISDQTTVLKGTSDKPISLKSIMKNVRTCKTFIISGKVDVDFPEQLQKIFNGSEYNINNQMTIEVFNIIYNGVVKTLSPYFLIKYANISFLGAYIPKNNDISIISATTFTSAYETSLLRGGGSYTDLGTITENTTITLPTYKNDGDLFTYVFKTSKANLKITTSETVKWSFTPTIEENRIYEYQFRYTQGVWVGGAIIYG